MIHIQFKVFLPNQYFTAGLGRAGGEIKKVGQGSGTTRGRGIIPSIGSTIWYLSSYNLVDHIIHLIINIIIAIVVVVVAIIEVEV